MTRVLVLAGAAVLLGGSPAQAFVPRAGGSVTFTEQLRDDLYAAGGTVEIRGEVDGDVTAAGGTVSLGGMVTGGVLAGAGTLRLAGTVGRSVRAAGGTVTLLARVGTDAVLTGGSVEVDPQAQIGRDLVAAGGNATLSGTVGRNAVLSGGDVVISGTVGGDVEVRAERLTLLPTARIQGRLRYRRSAPPRSSRGRRRPAVSSSCRLDAPGAAACCPRFRLPAGSWNSCGCSCSARSSLLWPHAAPV